MEYKTNYFFMDAMRLYPNKMSHSPIIYQHSSTPILHLASLSDRAIYFDRVQGTRISVLD
jgi:hypothetical protein